MRTQFNTITLNRAYTPLGTFGVVTEKLNSIDTFVCYMLERLWQNNERSKSCIPEGVYLLKKRFTPKRGWHVIVDSVPNRSFILIHSGADVVEDDELSYDVNNNKVDSLGCLLPQTNVMFFDIVNNNGKFPRMVQANSTGATKLLTEKIFRLIDTYGTAYLEITSTKYKY